MIDYSALSVLRDHVARNLPEYITFIGAVAIASVCMMPKNRPRTIDDWWDWLRDTLQTAVPAARSHSVSITTPQTTATATGANVSASTSAGAVPDPTSQQETK